MPAFSPVYVNDGLTLEFIDDDGPFPVQHFCFRVSEEEFDAILERIKAAGIKYRSSEHGPEDMQVNTQYGGRMVYWNEPDGHLWEDADGKLRARRLDPSLRPCSTPPRFALPGTIG